MKLRDFLLALTLLTSLTLSAQTIQDVVYLKNGETVRGEIVKHEFQGFNAPVQIRTADGTVLTFPMDEVDMVKYAERKGEEADTRRTSIPEGATLVESGAFSRRSDLKEITIPNSVIKIGRDVFFEYSGLTEVTIGSRVKTIYNRAFRGCSSLASIYSLNPQPPTCAKNVFYNVPTSTCILYVPKGSKEAYSTAYAWKKFKHIEEME